MAALAAVLCNAAILAALWLDLRGTERVGRSTDEIKTFALPVAAATETPDVRPTQRKGTPASPAPDSSLAFPAPTSIATLVADTPRTLPALPDLPVAIVPPREIEESENAQADAAWADYQAKVWAWIAARKPRGIHLPGEVLLAFTLDTEGRLVTAEIMRPGGNVQLDRLALRTLANAAPFPPPPPAVGNRPLRFTIRFGFRQ